MNTIDKYERVAALALHLPSDSSAYTVADLAIKLDRIAKKMRKQGDTNVNRAPADGHENMRKLLAKASTLARAHGLTVDESSDGMGYLHVFPDDSTTRPIAIFGDS